jgi:hypothetical protein
MSNVIVPKPKPQSTFNGYGNIIPHYRGKINNFIDNAKKEQNAYADRQMGINRGNDGHRVNVNGVSLGFRAGRRKRRSSTKKSRKLRRTKGRRTKRRYGRKRGGFLPGFPNPFSSKTSDTETECVNTCKAKETERRTAEEASNMEKGLLSKSEPLPKSEPPGPTGYEAVGGNGMNGGRRRRRRRSSKKRSSKKSRKSRKTKRRHRGGCIGHAFQPSIVNPPNSALANPAPFARYTTGP